METESCSLIRMAGSERKVVLGQEQLVATSI